MDTQTDKKGIRMRWLSNIYDPDWPEARHLIEASDDASRDEAWARHQAWLADKIIGDPVASEDYTVKQLRAMHIVGVYASD